MAPHLLERVPRAAAKIAGSARRPPHADAATPLRTGGFWLDAGDLVELIVACEANSSAVLDGGRNLAEDALGTRRSPAKPIRGKGRR